MVLWMRLFLDYPSTASMESHRMDTLLGIAAFWDAILVLDQSNLRDCTEQVACVLAVSLFLFHHKEAEGLHEDGNPSRD